MMINRIIRLKDDIIRWTSILLVSTFIVSLFLTALMSLNRNDSYFFMFLLVKNFSNLSFLVGSIVLGVGFIYAFFKKPDFSKTQIEEKNDNIPMIPVKKKNFSPKYRDGSPHAKREEVKKQIIYQSTSKPPLWTDKELKIILTGLLILTASIGSWIAFSLLFNLN